ncbi:methyltransferase domain-containing protein [Maioricimonas sp. JC845]|uniref:class I SAM-dependent methyltransferase n=1 Tax=Maioricimonas sp. JC845 TaxID=3232138 RepID=UPI00345ACD76
MYRRAISAAAHTSSRVLDIGCGYEAPDLASISAPDTTRVGIDIVTEVRPSRAPGVTFVIGNSEELPFADSSFSLVICRSVLEHIIHPPRVFHEVARVLEPGGRFLFLTPNRWDYVSLGASIIPNTFHGPLVKAMTGRAEEDTFPTYFRANSGRALRRLAKDCGLVVDRLEFVREHPHYLQFSAATYAAGIAFELTAQKYLPWIRPWIMGSLVKACPGATA